MAGTTQPLALLLDAAELILAESLANAFTTAKESSSSAIGTLSRALDTAFVAFWMTPPIAFVTPLPPAPPSMTGVVAVAPPGILSPLLVALFTTGADQENPASDQANNLSTVLNSWTKTVMVINTPITPPGPPLSPIPLN